MGVHCRKPDCRSIKSHFVEYANVMTIVMTCQYCSAQLKLEDQYAGKRIRCPKCLEVVTAPSATDAKPSGPTAKSTPSATSNQPAPSNRSAETSSRPSRQSPSVSKPKPASPKSDASQGYEYEYQYEYPSPGEGSRRPSRGASESRRSAPSSGGLSQGLLIGLTSSGLRWMCYRMVAGDGPREFR